MESGEKKDRPQNKNLKPFGSGKLTPEQEKAIREKGKPRCHESYRRNIEIRKIVQLVAGLGMGEGRVASDRSLKNVSDLDTKNVSQITMLVQAQFIKALQGDIEARNWICGMLGMSGTVNGSGDLTITADEDTPGLRIHLIRGDKPREDESQEDAATRAANRLAVVEAMRAIGEAAGDAVANGLNKGQVEDVTPENG